MATAPRRKSPAASKKTPPDTRVSQHAKKQMWSVILFAAGILVGALTYIKGDRLWLTLHNFLFGVFGWSVFFFAPLIIYIAVIAAMDKPASAIKNKLWQAVALIIMISAAIQVFSESLYSRGTIPETVKSLYEEGIQLEGGGIIGGLFALPLLGLFGKTGAAIIILLCVFVFFMLVTGSTLIGLFKSAAKPVKGLEGAYAASVGTRGQRRQKQDKTRPLPASDTNPEKDSRFNIDVDISKDTLIGADDGEVPWYDEPPVPDAHGMPEHPVLSEKTAAKDTPYGFTGDYIEYISPSEFEKHPDPAQAAPVPEPPRRHSLDDDIDRAERESASVSDVIDDIIGRFSSSKPDDQIADGEPSDIVTTAEEPTDGPDFNEIFADVFSGSFGDLGSEDLKQPESIPAFAEPIYENTFPHIYRHPGINLLKQARLANPEDVSEELKANAQTLVDTLKSFGVQTRILDICRGPSVTRYELQPSAGVKISKITGLADDIALNLASAGIRIEAPIPNKAAVGIEVPNKAVSLVSIREIIDSPEFTSADSSVAVSLGRDITGNIILADIAKMPHLLIAGSTGSGKSVCINSIIISLLYRSSPEEVKLLMIDPKVVELGVYNGIPHLLVPVVTDSKKAAGALNWAVAEMDRRYKDFAAHSVRDLNGYNRLAETDGELKPMPKIVIIIDELADLMMTAPNDVEDSICRLAQMARAAGMHLVIATQRPSVNVITGVIKANIPSRIAFAVSSQIDSRTILDMSGAEKLLGRGDMLFSPVGAAKPQRVQGCFVTDTEVERVVEFVKAVETAEYNQQIVDEIDSHVISDKDSAKDGGVVGKDNTLMQAIECIIETGKATTSHLQTKLSFGYAKAARTMDQLEELGFVGPYEESNKSRKILITKERWLEMKLAGNEATALDK